MALGEGRRTVQELLDTVWSDVPAQLRPVADGDARRAPRQARGRAGAAARGRAPALREDGVVSTPRVPTEHEMAWTSSIDSPFPPIADYGFLSDCHTGALVASDGSIEWMCLPHFDSPSVFGAMLDRGAGQLARRPLRRVRARRPALHPRHERDRDDLDDARRGGCGWSTRWRSATGTTTSTARATRARRPTTTPTTCSCAWSNASRGRCRSRSCASRCSTTAPPRRAGEVGRQEAHATALGALRSRPTASRRDGVAFRLFSDIRMGIEGNRAHGRHTMVEGERRFCALSWTEELRRPAHRRGGPGATSSAPSHFWRTWLAEGTYPDHPWRYHLQRSALALKGLTFMPTGALVAAPTTSLPETPRRRTQLGLPLLLDARRLVHALGACTRSASTGRRTTSSSTSPTSSATSDGSLQIMYGITRPEGPRGATLDHLRGYEGARPVRIGNGAYNQRQNDVYGAVLDSVYLHSKNRDHIPERLWPVLMDQVECAAKVWREPDQGIWEARGEPRHYVSSKLMCWVAHGSRRAAGRTARPATSSPSTWQALAEEIRAGHPRATASTSAACSASTTTPTRSTPRRCSCRCCASCRPTTSACARPSCAIRDELTENGLVLRYRTEDDRRRAAAARRARS